MSRHATTHDEPEAWLCAACRRGHCGEGETERGQAALSADIRHRVSSPRRVTAPERSSLSPGSGPNVDGSTGGYWLGGREGGGVAVVEGRRTRPAVSIAGGPLQGCG